MQIKDSYRIAGHWYSIQYRDQMDDFGKCDHDQCIIYIDANLTASQKEETLFHEVTHAMRSALGIDVRDVDEEEIIVQGMGNMLYQFLQDNDMLK